MSSKHLNSKRKYNEAGMVAIMVTLILMIVISLIVLGFAQISRRNQRQALDRQLSTQAFYAAETGVNDAAELIKSAVAGGATVAAKPDCASTGGGFYNSLVAASMLDNTNQVSYSCLLVDPTPPTLVYSSIGTTGTVVPVIASSGTISTLTLTWQTKDSGATPANNCPNTKNSVFSTVGGWGSCGYGVLRFDLVPASGPLTQAGLQAGAMTSFLVPLRPGSAAAINGIVAGTLINGGNNLLGINCSNSNCNLTITGLTQSQYYLRVSSLYKDVSLQISATNASGPVNLTGAQALIDVTGKAQDVLRRIQVRVPMAGSSTNLLSDYAIQSTEAICKRFAVMDGYFKNDANTAVPGVAAAHPNNDLCRLP